MNLHISPLSSLNNGYTFPFLGTNSSFNSIAWSHIFLIGIFSLTFFPKTLIHLWNHFGTNLLASSSDFAASSSLFQISHSLATFVIFIVFSLFCFFFFFFFSSSFSSHFLLSSFFFSFSFCFCYLDLPCLGLHCLPHSSEYIIILTSPIFQLISRL